MAELARLGYAQTDERCGAKAVKHMGPLYKDANGKYLCTCAAHVVLRGDRACCQVLQDGVPARERVRRVPSGRARWTGSCG